MTQLRSLVLVFLILGGLSVAGGCSDELNSCEASATCAPSSRDEVGGGAGSSGKSGEGGAGASIEETGKETEETPEPVIDACGNSCKGDLPACDPLTGDCVECVFDSDCKDGKYACDRNRLECVGCLEDKHCPEETPYCNPSDKECFECKTNDDCSGTTPICNQDTSSCEACSSDEQCSGADLGSFCKPETDPHIPGACAECETSDDCEGEVICSPFEGICDTSALENARFYCDPCKYDDECSFARCVTLEYEATEPAVTLGNYCIPIAYDCFAPALRVKLESVEGVSYTACSPNPKKHTCELWRTVSASCVEDSACGHPELSDMICSDIDPGAGVKKICTHVCEENTDCWGGNCALHESGDYKHCVTTEAPPIEPVFP